MLRNLIQRVEKKDRGHRKSIEGVALPFVVAFWDIRRRIYLHLYKHYENGRLKWPHTGEEARSWNRGADVSF
jgi:hypothetical protein